MILFKTALKLVYKSWVNSTGDMEFYLRNLLDSEKKSPWNEYVVRWNRRNKIEKTNGYTCIPKERKGTQTAYFF